MDKAGDFNQSLDKFVHHLMDELNIYDSLKQQIVREELVKLGKPAVPYLILHLSSPSERTRWEAAVALGEIGDPRAAEALVAALQDESIDVRWTAMGSLIALNQATIPPLLLALRKDFGSAWLRQGAHHILHVLVNRADLPAPVIKVFKALESIEPEMEVPWAVEKALEEMHIPIENGERKTEDGHSD